MSAFNLDRFIEAQHDSYAVALSELQNEKKTSHWIWCIFPQLKGLWKSYMSEFYGLCGIEEAKAYIDDPILGSRLIQATRVIIQHRDKTAEEILGPDAKNFARV